MQEAALLTPAVALMCLLITWRQGVLSEQFVRITAVLAAWGLLQLAATVWWPPGWPLWVETAGHLTVWVVALALFLPEGGRSWLLPITLVLLLLSTLLPQAAIHLLRWGPISALPLIALWRPAAAATADRLPSPTGTSLPLLDALPDGLILADREGLITYVNRGAAAMLGTSPAEIDGQSIVNVLARLPMLDDPTRVEGGGARFEMNGRQIQGRVQLLEDAGKGRASTLAILTDVTAAYQTERARQALLTNLSHQLRTPLTAVKSSVDMLLGETAAGFDRSQQAYLNTITRNVSRMVDLINHLIFIVAAEEAAGGQRQSYADLHRLVPLVIEQLAPLAERQSLVITHHLAADLQPIQIDSDHLTTILYELIDNSLKYTEPGGIVRVSVERQAGESAGGDVAVFQIADSGIGIQPDSQRAIMDELFREDDKVESPITGRGLGVGLAIVRALVGAYGGRIWLESEPGEGSRFTFVLPAAQHSRTAEPLPAIL